jgi:DNA-binding NarL/FixJ family response regulator
LRKIDAMKMMLVEDSDIIRAVLRDLVAQVAGARLSGEFSGAPSAIAGLRSDPPDVVLLDIELEVGKGMDVLSVASAEYPATKVIVVTNYADAIYRTHYSNAGAYRFYDKSHELGALRGCLERLVMEERAATGIDVRP